MSKIVMFHPGCYLGGGGLGALNMCRMLRELGHEVIILNCTYSKEMYEEFKKNDFRCIEHAGLAGAILNYSGSPRIYSRTFITAILNLRKTKLVLKKVLIEENPDIIIVNSLVLCWTSIIFKKFNVKSICHIRETLKSGIIFKLMKNMLEKFDCIFFISDYDKEKYNLNIKNQYVVCDTLSFTPIKIDKTKACRKLNIKENTFNVLYVGGEAELKGWTTVRKCMESCKIKDISFVITGNVRTEKRFNSENVVYLGVMRDMNLVYSSCDVLIAPSSHPHQLMPIFESGNFNIPVITTEFESFNANVENNINGFLIKPNEVESLMEKILLLYTNKKLRKYMGDNNYLYSRQHMYSEVINQVKNAIGCTTEKK